MVEHSKEWLGFPVKVYDPAKGKPDYRNTVYRLASEWDAEQPLMDQLVRFLEDPDVVQTPAIIFGLYGEHDSTSQPLIETLVAARERLPKLQGIFLGDIVSEENEISWIHQSDVSPLFTAFPQLEHFRVRGAGSLTLGRISHSRLRSLVIESGGLPTEILSDVLGSTLPALEHLELWLGTEYYGWDGTVADLAPLWTGGLFPKLKYLGLVDSEIADDIARTIADAPILGQIQTLDLSLGTLTDLGAEALLASPYLQNLRKLDLHRHYLSKEMTKRIETCGVRVDVSDRQEADDEEDRYVAVGE